MKISQELIWVDASNIKVDVGYFLINLVDISIP